LPSVTGKFIKAMKFNLSFAEKFFLSIFDNGTPGN
jgi:hypothetical protein